jgi:signal transduction histidine kinase
MAMKQSASSKHTSSSTNDEIIETRQQRDLAQDSPLRESEIKAEFVSLASHQMRTPLSIVGWYAELLKDGGVGPLNDRQKKCVDEILRANHIMVELVNALLNVARIESGTFSIEPETLDMCEITRYAVRELEPAIFKRRLDVREVYHSDSSSVVGDRNLTKIILENLLSNAIKYTPEEGRVDLSVMQTNKGVTIVVADTGFGIPEEAQHFIFTKLFRAENIRGQDTDGTGLGLYIVKSIVDALGGSIRFESIEGKGTTFFVHLPSGGIHAKAGIAKLR